MGVTIGNFAVVLHLLLQKWRCKVNDTRTALTIVKTQPPKGHDADFIEVARKIYHKAKTNTPESNEKEIASLKVPRYRDIAQQLEDAAISGGIEDYKLVYDVLEQDNPSLKIYRKVVEDVPPVPDDKPLLEERPYQLHTFSYFKNLPKRQWAVDKLMYDKGVSAWVGDGGSGKSAVVLTLMLCRAYSRQCFGRPVKQGCIVWVAAESVDEIYPRVYGWQLHNNIDTTMDPNILFLDERVPFNNHQEIEVFIVSIQAQAEEMNITIDGFVFDTYARCTPGADENNTLDAKNIAASMSRISEVFNTHVAVIHHTNSQGKTRGSTVLRDDVDTLWIVTKVGETVKLHCDKMRGSIETPDFSLKMLSQIIDDNNPDSTAPVLIATEGNNEEPIVPQTQMQILGILYAHGKLSCNAWAKHCKEAHGVSNGTFYTYRDKLEKENLIESSGEKARGKAIYYNLTEKGVETIG